MIVRRIILAVVSLGLLGAAASTMVFAAAFAFYALLRSVLTPAEAGAAIAFGAAVIAAGAALLLSLSAKTPSLKLARPRTAITSAGQIDRLITMVRERPFVSAGAAVATGLIVIANPQVAAAVVRAVLDSRSSPKQ